MNKDQKRHKDDYIRLLNQFENDFDNMTPSDHKFFLRLEEVVFKGLDPRIFNPYDTILEKLEEFDSDYKLSGMANVFSHLIKLLGEEDFNGTYIANADHYENYDNFYFNFHKQFRQCDIYDFQGAELISKTAIAKDPEKYEKRAEKRDGDIVGGYILFRIGSHLDMIFWNAIHAGNEVWDKAFQFTYDKYVESKQVTV